jgi:hypothetical protein
MDIGGVGGVTTQTASSTAETITAQGTTAESAGAAAVSAAALAGSEAATALVYSSPVIALDAVTGAMIWQYRDSSSGEQLYQSPSRTALLYQRSDHMSQPEPGTGDAVALTG